MHSTADEWAFKYLFKKKAKKENIGRKTLIISLFRENDIFRHICIHISFVTYKPTT